MTDNGHYGVGRWLFDPGAFKLDHLEPFKPISFWQDFISLIFILEAISYYPRGLIERKGRSEKREFSQLQKLMRNRGLSALGIQTGLLAAL